MEFFHKNIVFAIGSRIKGRDIISKYNYLKKQEFLSREEILTNSFKKLRKLLMFSYENVPFYHNLWKEIGFIPSLNFNSLNDMEKIPILTKNDIRENLQNMISKDFEKSKLIENYSGGSTGEPIIFYNTIDSKDWSTANIYRHYNMCRWNFGDKHAFLWGAERDEPQSIIQQKIRRFRWYNAFKLSEENLMEISKSLQRYKPKLLIGYPSALFQLAIFLEEKKLSLKIPNIQSSAEKLFQFQREKIEENLSGEIFDRYGCREVGNIAHECQEHSDLHIAQEILNVEIIDNNNKTVSKGERGSVILTDLENYGMPFIRYRNDDEAVICNDFCACGRKTLLLKPIIGRISDNFISPKGKIIHGEYFTHLFYKKPEIKQFQLIQEKVDLIEISVVPKSSVKEKQVEKVVKDIKREILEWIDDDSINFEINIVNEIDITKTGKYRFTYSKIWNKILENNKH